MESQKTYAFPTMMEGWAKIDETAKITGIALIPRISRNNNLYTKKELARFNNIRVPLNWEHNPNKQIGHVTFYYNPETEQVYYEGMIEDESAALLAKNKTLFTSIEANPANVKQVCNEPGDCFSMPSGLVPTGLALTETPGVPETSVQVLEHYIEECAHDNHLEQKYVPDQTNLKNEQHISHMLGEVGQNPDADDQCIQDKIVKLGEENPDMPTDQRIAVAISMCTNKETIKHMMSEGVREYFCDDCGELKKN